VVFLEKPLEGKSMTNLATVKEPKLAHDYIVKARAKLMKGNVGMASMLLHLKLVEVDQSRCDTMATDGKVIYYYPEFVLGLSEPELQGVLVHEALHVVYEHPLRRGKRHPKIWNIACDYVINAYLYWDLKLELPLGGLLSYKYKGMTAEKVYSILVKDEDALEEAIDQINQQKPKGEESSDEEDAQTQGGSEATDEEGDELSETGTGNISEPKTDWDSIPSAIGEVWDATNDEGKPLTDAEMQEVKGEIQRAISLSEKLEIAMSSNGSSGGLGSADANQNVQVNWRDQLNDLLQSSVADEITWSRLNKRHQHRGINLPSRAKSPQGGELAIMIDTSGSVSQYELNMFATEIQAMAVDCGLDKIRVCYCDSVVRKNQQGEWWDIYELDQGDDLELQVRGGGGTRFDPPFNLFNDYSDDVDDVLAIVYFTDGWGEVSPEVEPDVPVFWAVTDKSSYSENLAFGEVIYVETADFYN
jgi:predicted metal-dependent peptidase